MKVLHLISGGDTGGAKTHIISLIKGIDRLIDAKIICFIEDTFYHEAKSAGINIEVYKQKKRSDMSVITRLVDEIQNKGYDIIHCHGARANFIAMFLRGKIKKSFITTIHSDYELDFKDNFYKKIIFTSLNKFALRRFNHFVAISDTFKDMLVSRGFKEEEIFTAYNGIDMDQKLEYVSKEEFLGRYNIDYKDKTIVGIAARLDRVKDHETFIKAAAMVLEKRKDIIFLIAGDGYERTKLVSLTEQLNIQENVHFLGYIRDPNSLFNVIDINTLTSLSESFPYAILEGARMNKTIISTNVGGVSKLIEDGKNGFLIEVGDTGALANRIDILASDKEKARLMGEKLNEKVREKYSSDAMAREHLKIYEEITEDKSNVLISGYYGFDNSGDDAILKAIVKDIKSQSDKLNITVLSKNPIKTKEFYEVNAIDRFKPKEVLGAIKNCNLFISGGGSLLQDVTSTRSLLYYLAIMKVAKLYRKPVMVYANGIGPISKKLNRYLAREILNKVDLITLRDDNSKEFIDGLGVKNKNIVVTSDPVFTLDPASEERIKEIFNNENIDTTRRFIGVSVRQWKYTENLTEIIADTIRHIIKEYNVNVLMIPMHYPEDLEISIKISEILGEENCYVLTEKYNVEEIMGIIKEMEIIIAMRLHSLIYAATQQVPMVGLSYDPKINGILHSIGMDYICDVRELDYNSLIEKIDHVWNNRIELKEQLKKQDEELKTKALSNVTMALDLLKDR